MQKKPYIVYAGSWVDEVDTSGLVYRKFQQVPLRRFAGYVQAWMYAGRLEHLLKAKFNKTTYIFFVLSEEYEMQNATEKKNG